jgi:cytochrome c
MTRPLAGLVIAGLLFACSSGGPGASPSSSTTVPAGGYALGRAATAAEIAAVDLDVGISGEGLPPGRGDATHGEQIFRDKCSVCHGARGEGVPPNPKLIGREPREGFPFANDLTATRTIGNFWPYATTLFDYVRRAMPLANPGTLSSDDLYSVTAYLLAANEVLPAGATLDSATLVAVKMPARERFVRDDRKGGPEIK